MLHATTPSWSRLGFQGRGHNLGGHQGARFKQQAQLVESHNGFLPRHI
jgi:hypothetical protein